MQAAFFDLDKTVIAKAALMAFGRPLHSAGYISRWLVLRALYGQFVFRYFGADEARMAKMRQTSLRLAKGWERDKISALVRETLNEVIDPIVYAEALELFAIHRHEGRRVFIVSASPEEIVLPLAEYLGVEHAIATRAEVDDEGRYTGSVAFYAYGPYKVDAICEAALSFGIDLDSSYAYSDSITDLPMLETVGHPVVVNPDRELRRVAQQRGWPVERWERTVTLHTERNLKRPVMIGTGSAALAAAGAATLWYWRRGRSRPLRWRSA